MRYIETDMVAEREAPPLCVWPVRSLLSGTKTSHKADITRDFQLSVVNSWYLAKKFKLT